MHRLCIAWVKAVQSAGKACVQIPDLLHSSDVEKAVVGKNAAFAHRMHTFCMQLLPQPNAVSNGVTPAFSPSSTALIKTTTK